MRNILVEYGDLDIYYKEYMSQELANKAYLKSNELGISCQLMNDKELDVLLNDSEDNKYASDGLYN